MKLDDPEPLLYHGESVLRDGKVVGRVTSGAYGHTVGAAVGLAFIEAPPGEIDAIVASPRCPGRHRRRARPATLSERPFYDPDGRRLRG